MNKIIRTLDFSLRIRKYYRRRIKILRKQIHFCSIFRKFLATELGRIKRQWLLFSWNARHMKMIDAWYLEKDHFTNSQENYTSSERQASSDEQDWCKNFQENQIRRHLLPMKNSSLVYHLIRAFNAPFTTNWVSNCFYWQLSQLF